MSFGRDTDECLCRDEWDLCKNNQPVVLVGRGSFGALVLDNLFLKATEESLTSPKEAGAFVRNVRGVTLYGDDKVVTKSYEIEKFFGGKLRYFERKLEDTDRGRFSHTLRHVVFVTQGSMLINPAMYGKNLTRDVCIYSTFQFGKLLWSNISLMFSFLHGPQHLCGSTCG